MRSRMINPVMSLIKLIPSLLSYYSVILYTSYIFMILGLIQISGGRSNGIAEKDYLHIDIF